MRFIELSRADKGTARRGRKRSSIFKLGSGGRELGRETTGNVLLPHHPTPTASLSRRLSPTAKFLSCASSSPSSSIASDHGAPDVRSRRFSRMHATRAPNQRYNSSVLVLTPLHSPRPTDRHRPRFLYLPLAPSQEEPSHTKRRLGTLQHFWPFQKSNGPFHDDNNPPRFSLLYGQARFTAALTISHPSRPNIQIANPRRPAVEFDLLQSNLLLLLFLRTQVGFSNT